MRLGLKRLRDFSRALVCAAVVVSGGIAHADLSGEVVAVQDGDTLDVLVELRPVRVRLAQIDAPEKKQAFGTKSRQALAAMVFRKQVVVVTDGRDRYGRVIGTVFVNGVDVNAKMVSEGMAWAYSRYVKDKALYALESEARVARRGLWFDPAPVAPWEWRRSKREAAGF